MDLNNIILIDQGCGGLQAGIFLETTTALRKKEGLGMTTTGGGCGRGCAPSTEASAKFISEECKNSFSLYCLFANYTCSFA